MYLCLKFMEITTKHISVPTCELSYTPDSNYVEITLDNNGLLQFMDLLRSKKGKLSFPLSNTTSDMISVRWLEVKPAPKETFSGTDCHIMCLCDLESSTVQFHFDEDGFSEIQYILNFINETGDHFHMFADFDLFVGKEESEEGSVIGAVTIYLQEKSNCQLSQ